MLWYGKSIKERINLMKKYITYMAFFVLLPTIAQAFSVKHDFFVTVGAFDASLTEFTYSLTPDDYKITSVVSTNGLFDSIYPFQATYHTSGKISNEQMIATDYNYTSKSRFNTRGKQVFFNTEGEPLYQISTRKNKTKKRLFEQSPTPADTFDLLTIFAKMAKQYNEFGFCDSRLAVYDGKRRFDVIFKDEGEDILPPSENSFYSGRASRCTMQIEKLLSDDDDSLWEFSANKPIYFWIAKDPETGIPFIAKVTIKSTPLGELNAHTSKITIKE